MTFISTIEEEKAEDDVKALYSEVMEQNGFIPNFVQAFSHRPLVLKKWGHLLEAINSQMEPRRYELVTIAAAQALQSSYCMLAHGSVLLRETLSEAELKDIVENSDSQAIDETERLIMSFAKKVVWDASSITQSDIDDLKSAGLRDEEIFDIASAAAARCFFSKTLDAMGVKPDMKYQEMNEELRKALVVGRSIE